ncbi:hypothetical protein [Comamonas sp. JC664]|uniref:hypothetical protein n=1 Tax=Comamonas sp. JC664 TaxID=2801917 RepID=UPI0025745514|nr:hypothetical protein [Comamonas sp. JC664]
MTLVAFLVPVLGHGVTLPDLFHSLWGNAVHFPEPDGLNLFKLGLVPFLCSFVVVELIIAMVPSWRILRRSGPVERGGLRTLALIFGGLFAVIAALGVTLLKTSPFLWSKEVDLPLVDGHYPFDEVWFVLAVAPFFLHALTVAVDRYGLGSGYAAVLLGLTVPEVAEALMRWRQPWAHTGIPLGTVVPLVLVLGAILLCVSWMMTGAARELYSHADAPVAPRIPTGGLIPAYLATGFIGFRSLLLPFGRSEYLWLEALCAVALLAVATGGLSACFYWPGSVGSRWAAYADPSAGCASQVRTRMTARAKAMLPSATTWSVLFGLVVVLPTLLIPRELDLPLMTLPCLVLAVAWVLDVWHEARARRHHTWTPTWSLHSVLDVEPALGALTAADIPAVVRGARVRSLFHIFGPFHRLDVLVLPGHVEAARRVLGMGNGGWPPPVTDTVA